ncbi:phosphopeptide-binding protein [Acinetobacter sp. KAM398]|uniref:FHA domain-containing protein n=1 Tax=Acinetobacter TaxID=469 RepID=UPI000378BE73|nr:MULTISPECIES: FHA domain-containing protein [Acinetobacter]MDM1755399.1 FHA domain-containing protein [Acinetobacter towneri]GJC31700.1 phosphopeptide-binding protein [Acinetobacter sp. KAM392]GJC34509.1 phosphopeptide-binding protein [Acinetobacter sp. KAM393]GJC37330.1 phosphopeptide-binding protein [Acinetobacter sp. KAM394]GJC40213.1 phosphopeptide-binding protein [Acinetobacter sp. KAM395]
MTWKIQAISGEFTGQEISIDRDMLVGRHQSADLVLQSAEISRKHAAFLLKEQALYVQDLNSSNGSFVNDLRIADETLLKEGDIVQFASLKFSVLAPAVELEHAADVAETADKVTAQTEKTPAQQMNEQGMPELNQRDSSVQLNRDGMPQGVAVPKPAPIPEGVDIHAAQAEPTPVPVEQPVSRVELEKEQQKNASVGLISLVVLVILAVLAWLLFK